MRIAAYANAPSTSQWRVKLFSFFTFAVSDLPSFWLLRDLFRHESYARLRSFPGALYTVVMTPSATKMQTSSRGGRPKQIDRRRVSALALELFERDGFDRVTMNDIAKAASVSRRTLFREFPSKADLVWDGLDEIVAAERAQIAVARPNATLRELIEEIVAPSLRAAQKPPTGDLARRRLRIIAANPELLHHQTLNELRAVITAIVATSDALGDRPAELVADAIVAVGFSASLWWAAQDGKTTLLEAFHIALGALGEASAE